MRAEESSIPVKKYVSTEGYINKVTVAEDVAFDKAEQAEKSENEKIKLKNEIEVLENMLKETNNDEKKQIQLEVIAQKKKALESLNNHDKTE